MSTPARKPRVLIVNDDGAPTSSTGHSPFVYPFARAVQRVLGWEVKVVVPAGQQSWKGKSYNISQEIRGEYFYPSSEDGSEGERRELPRETKEGEMEIILLDGTPATCANLGLFGLYPEGTFDLVISGPNLGRNTSTAFALSSGTVGAAMSAAIAGTPAIALSWGLMTGFKPPTQDLIDGALTASCKVISKLWELGFPESYLLYTVNIPLLPSLNQPGGPEVRWTTMARTAYGRLFEAIDHPAADEGGPATIPEPTDETVKPAAPKGDGPAQLEAAHQSRPLRFAFAPDIRALVDPSPESLLPGTDTHALHEGAISVAPIRCGFEPAKVPEGIPTAGGTWKL